MAVITERKKRLINRVNESVLLNLIREKGPLARKDIADITKLDPSTVTRITNRLIAEKLVKEGEEIDTGNVLGGRKLINLEINSDGGYLIGLDIGAWKMKAVITDLNSQPIHELMRFTMGEDEKENIIKRIYDLVDESI